MHHKSASDLITGCCEPPCGCWDLKSGPLEEQSVFLTTEPSLQPPELLKEITGKMRNGFYIRVYAYV